MYWVWFKFSDSKTVLWYRCPNPYNSREEAVMLILARMSIPTTKFRIVYEKN